MSHLGQRIDLRRRTVAGILLLCFVAIAYCNTLNASWHFDDLPNITLNPHIHLDSLDPGSIKQSFFASVDKMRFEGRRLYRPVAMFSFALNWFAAQEDVTGYHLVNMMIHALTAVWLYAVILSLLQTPNLSGRSTREIHHIALLTAVLWAVHPIHTQAVTYIVQRMAILATFFTVGAIYGYLRFRMAGSAQHKAGYFAFTIICFFLSVGSKENAAMLPVSLALLEITCFQDLSEARKRRILFGVGAGVIVSSGLLLIILFYGLKGNPVEFINTLYSRRPFTMTERLLTEPRIIFRYIELLIWPSPERLSLIHDIRPSTSLLQPWTTLPAIVGLAGLAAIGIALIRRRPLISFAVLFYLLNHLIESSIIPLELYFEHRNHLPSLFLFLPLGVFAVWVFNRLHHRGKIFRWTAMLTLAIVLAGLGLGTYTRNLAWSDPQTLWLDVLRKAPETARPYQMLADHLVARGRPDMALDMHQKALNLEHTNPEESQALSLNNMGNIYNSRGDYRKAAQLFRMAIKTYPEHEIARYNLVHSLIRMQELEEALAEIDALLERNYKHNKYLNAKGFILFKMKAYHQALQWFRYSIRMAPSYRDALVNLGMTMSRLGFYERADWFLRLAQDQYPEDPLVMACRIDTAAVSGNAEALQKNVDMMVHALTFKQLLSDYHEPTSPELLPYEPDIVWTALRVHAAEKLGCPVP